MEPPSIILNLSFIQFHSAGLADTSNWLMLVLLFVLLFTASLISAAEVAFFSLSVMQIDELKKNRNQAVEQNVLEQLSNPKKLIATFLIAINLVNIGVVIISSQLLNNKELVVFDSELIKFLIQVVLITFLILIIGEVVPKIYASRNAMSLVKKFSIPFNFVAIIFKPLVWILVNSTDFIERRIVKKANAVSVSELSHALELASGEIQTPEEKTILKGIVKFGSTDARQVMTPRMDMVTIDAKTTLPDLIKVVNEKSFSRIPIYSEHIDNIIGILHIKDLLKHIDESDQYDWTQLLRPAYYIPENKKIDDLLKEFQIKKKHMALVVDEYGGLSGIITFEDVIEEIVGEINDEFDEENLFYSQLDETTFLFEAKTSLNDVYKVLKIDGTEFEEVKGESDTLGGFIIEREGRIPLKNEYIVFSNFVFTIESADIRKVKRIKIEVQKQNGNTINES